jgi:hypothetical protein
MTRAGTSGCPGLPASATYQQRELAHQPRRAPRFLDEQIITRLERDDGLGLLPEPERARSR